MLTDKQKQQIAQHAQNNPMPKTTGRPKVAGMPLHVDGDYLAYYCSGNAETSQAAARQSCVERVQAGAYVSGADRIIIHLSTPGCTKGLRYLVADSPTSKPYQGQRKAGSKPVNWQHLRDWLDGYEGPLFTVQQWQDREADDGIAWASEAAYAMGRPSAVMTADKDLRMFAGLHVVWKTYQIVDVLPGTYDLCHDGKQYGHKWFWMQMLTGDTADNILGLPGVGEVAATRLLKGTTCNEQAMEIVLKHYQTKMGDKYLDHFVEQAALLWMRTDKLASPTDYLKLVPYPDGVVRASERLLERLRTHRANPYNGR